MSDPVPAFHYALERAGDYELPVVRRGPETAPLIVFAQPLFEEHNRCRRFFADLGRALAGLDIATALPDLPRTGDHMDVRPFDFDIARAALDIFISQQPGSCIVSLRGGCLLPDARVEHFALSPVANGERLLIDLIRTHAVGMREHDGSAFSKAEAVELWAQDQTQTLAGYAITPAAADWLSAATYDHSANILDVAGARADIDGPTIWRQAEPEPTGDVARQVAKRLADWVDTL